MKKGSYSQGQKSLDLEKGWFLEGGNEHGYTQLWFQVVYTDILGNYTNFFSKKMWDV